jgi:predicted nuclease of predicted toxin-antitoxin system
VTPPRLLANENVPYPALMLLRERGIEIESVMEDMRGATDAAVLAHACKQGQWLLTFDRDYGELVFANAAPAPPAIVYVRQGPYPPEQLADMVQALLQDAEFVVGHLVVVSGRSMRRRPLPAAV